MLAAHRSGITTVVVPKENRKDLREIPRRVLKATRVVLVEHMDDVLREALCLPDANALFGPPRAVMEYREGELYVGGERVEARREAPQDDLPPHPQAEPAEVPARVAPEAEIS
jgi:ATP-dependent Lon protease